MKLEVDLSDETSNALQAAADISGQTVEEIASLLLDSTAPLAAQLAAAGRDRKEARKHEPRPEFEMLRFESPDG